MGKVHAIQYDADKITGCDLTKVYILLVIFHVFCLINCHVQLNMSVPNFCGYILVLEMFSGPPDILAGQLHNTLIYDMLT